MIIYAKRQRIEDEKTVLKKGRLHWDRWLGRHSTKSYLILFNSSLSKLNNVFYFSWVQPAPWGREDKTRHRKDTLTLASTLNHTNFPGWKKNTEKPQILWRTLSPWNVFSLLYWLVCRKTIIFSSFFSIVRTIFKACFL